MEDNNDLIYDTSKLLKLLESISLVTESTTLQAIINCHLKELLGAQYVLMVPLLPASEEGLIQVVNDQILEKEFRFSVSCDQPPKLRRDFFGIARLCAQLENCLNKHGIAL